MVIYWTALFVGYMAYLVFYFAISFLPYIALITAIFAKVRHRLILVTTVRGTVLYSLGIYPWITMMVELFDRKLPDFISNIAFYAANLCSLSICYLVWVDLYSYRSGKPLFSLNGGDPDLIEYPFLVTLLSILPFFLLFGVLVSLTPRFIKCMIRINAGASWVEPEKHSCKSIICIDCMTPFALLTFWAGPTAVMQHLQEKDSSIFYTPFSISVDLPANASEYSYIVSAMATVIWFALLLYPPTRRTLTRRTFKRFYRWVMEDTSQRR